MWGIHMKKIILIASGSKKKAYPTTARNMYSESHIFRSSYEYARTIGDEVYILSPKYGILSSDQVIDNYEEKMEDQTMIERRIWGKKVIDQLGEKTDLEKDCFIFLTEKIYYEYLILGMNYYEFPLKNINKMQWVPYINKLIIDEQNKMYNKEITGWGAQQLHRRCHMLPKYDYLTIDKIPFENGIYLMVDKYEVLYGYPRIIRIGTHRGEGRLKGRVAQHFLTEDKNGSSLRRYIGSALLSRNKDAYLSIWEVNSRSHMLSTDYKNKIDINKERQIEAEVSKYLREHVYFYCIEADSYENRLELKKNMMKCLYSDNTYKPSNKWLGNDSPMLHIKAYGLWNSELNHR